MDPITMTRTIGYLRQMTKDRRYITDIDLVNHPVPVPTSSNSRGRV